MTRAVLIRASDAAIHFGPFDIDRPIRVDAPGSVSISPAFVGWASPNGAWRIVEYVERDFARPGRYFSEGATSRELAGDVLTVTKTWTAWTQAEIDAFEAGQRDANAAEMDELESLTRAAVLVIMDELNRHSDKITELGQAIAGASSLADVKSRVSAIQPIPQRSGADLKAAIRQKLGAA